MNFSQILEFLLVEPLDGETLSCILKETETLDFLANFVVDNLQSKSEENDVAKTVNGETSKSTSALSVKANAHLFLAVSILQKAAECNSSEIESWAFT